MAASLSLLYTANLAGELAILPRLHSFLQRLQNQATGRTLLLDLGGSCSDASWHCRATGNRSMLIALDGMGYHAANCERLLDAEARDKLAEQVSLKLVDARNPCRWEVAPGIEIAFVARPDDSAEGLNILLEGGESNVLEGDRLRLGAVRSGQVGQIIIEFGDAPRLVSATAHELPEGSPPNPSIAGMVEFVEAEARHYMSKIR